MNQLYFEGRVVNLYSEDYQFLQNAVNDKVTDAIKYFIANQNESCIIQGFKLKRSTEYLNTFDIVHETESGKGAVISGTYLIFDTETEFTSQYLKTYIPETVVGIYIKLDHVLASYDRKNDEIVYEKKAIDHYNQTLVYNRRLVKMELQQLTDVEFDLLPEEEKLKYILIGEFIANGDELPISEPSYDNVKYMLIRVGEHTITIDNLAHEFMLPQENIDPTATDQIKDNYYNDPPGINLTDNLNHIRTMIRNIKGTESWDYIMEGVVGSVPEMNALFKVGIFKAQSNFDLEEINGDNIIVGSGVALLGNTIKSIFYDDPRTLDVPSASRITVGEKNVEPYPLNGEEHEVVGPAPTSFFLNSASENYVHFRSEDLMIMDSILKTARIYVEGTDYILDTSTGEITAPIGSAMIDRLVEAYYTCSTPRIDAVIVDDISLKYVEGTPEAKPKSPTLAPNTTPLYFIYRQPFKDLITEEDVTDVRLERQPVRESTVINYDDIGSYDNLDNFYDNRFWSLHKYSIIEASTNHSVPKGKGWDIITESWGSGTQLDIGYSYQAIMHFQRNDELWISISLQNAIFDVTVEIENVLNSGNFDETYTTMISQGSVLSTEPTPICLVEGISAGFKRVRIRGTAPSFVFNKLLIGKYDHYFFKDHMFLKSLTTHSFKADNVDIGALALEWTKDAVYKALSITVFGDRLYKCVNDHVATNFYVDYQAGNWIELSSSQDAQVRIDALREDVAYLNNKVSTLMIENSILLNRKSSASHFIIDLCNNRAESNKAITTARMMDENAFNNNWNNMGGVFLQGYVKAHSHKYMLETMDIFNLEGVGQVSKSGLAYDQKNNCYWLLTSAGINANGEIIRLSTNFDEPFVEVAARYTLPASGASIGWSGLASDGDNLYVVAAGANTASSLYCYPINSDGSLGLNYAKSGEALTLAADSRSFAVNNASDTGVWNDVFNYSDTEIGVLLCNTTTVSIMFRKKSDGTVGTTPTITGLGHYVGGSLSYYRSIAKHNNDLFICVNDNTDNKRFIYKFNLVNDIKSNVVIRSSGRFANLRNVNCLANQGSPGVTVGHDGFLYEVVNTASNGKLIAKRALNNGTLWAENQVVSELKTRVIVPTTPLACMYTPDGAYWTGDETVTANTARIVRYKFDGAVQALTLTGKSWVGIQDITCNNDYIWILGRTATQYQVVRIPYADLVYELDILAPGATGALNLTTQGASITALEANTQVYTGMCFDGDAELLYLTNITTNTVDTLDLEGAGAVLTAGVYALGTPTHTWWGVAYKNFNLYVRDRTNTTTPDYVWVIPTEKVTASTPWRAHIHQDPSLTFIAQGTYCLDFHGEDLIHTHRGLTTFYVTKTLEDINTLQVNTFIDNKNLLLSNNVTCVTPVVKRHFRPADYVENLRYSKIKPTHLLYHGAYTIGTSPANINNLNTRQLIVNGTAITFNQTFTELWDVIVWLNNQFTALSITAKAFVHNEVYVGIYSTNVNNLILAAGSPNALMDLSLEQGTYTFVNSYTVRTEMSVRNVPDSNYMALGYGDEGFTILNLDTYLAKVLSSGLPRYDVKDIRFNHYKRGANNAIFGATFSCSSIWIDRDVIYVANNVASQGTVAVMLKEGVCMDINTGRRYNGNLSDRNQGLGYIGTTNTQLALSNTIVRKIEARTFTKEDASAYQGQNPKTFVAIGTDTGCDILIIDWGSSRVRALSKVWRNVMNVATAGQYGVHIAESGTLFLGSNLATGTMFRLNIPIWELESETSVSASLFTASFASAGGFIRDISPQSRCWKSSSGQWRHYLLIGTAQAAAAVAAANVGGVVVVDAENGIVDRALARTTSETEIVQATGATEDLVFAVFGRVLSNFNFGLKVLKKYKFNSKNLDSFNANVVFSNNWGHIENIMSTTLPYIMPTATGAASSGAPGGCMYSSDYNLLSVSSQFGGLQFYHMHHNQNDSLYESIEVDVPNFTKFLYKGFEKITKQ